MKKNTVRFFQAAVFATIFTGVASAELVRNPTQVGAAFDVGQIVKGTLYDGSDVTSKFKGDDQQIARTGVYLTESGTYNDRLSIYLTVGGLFWYALPEGSSFQTHRIYFGPGVGQAQGVYAFGEDPAKPAATLQFGLFGHKYSDAVNLGEYLYRSGTYPGVLTSGGWSYINAASYMAQGARVTVPMLNGMVTNDFTMYMERDLEPTNDFTPGYAVTAKPLPFVELGAGVVWSHALSLSPSRLAPKKLANEYSKATQRPSNNAGGAATDTCPCGYYTFKGFKTMARASVDIGSALGVDWAKPGEFKAYSEIALLGVEDQPYYYEKKAERMPVMFGLDIPTFGLLNKLAFEMEYHKSRFSNTNGTLVQNQLPLPINNGEDISVYDLNSAYYTSYTADQKDSVADLWKKDDWKWTVYARKEVTKGVSIYAQAANDHLRHFNFTATPSALPATTRPSDWYYVLRLEFGI